ncbi:MAG TPA: hypothetical protein VK106_02925, partial [Balneolaceae bacterium]|nr:hypothetical protein [Balneolaceae bacterium]
MNKYVSAIYPLRASSCSSPVNAGGEQEENRRQSQLICHHSGASRFFLAVHHPLSVYNFKSSFRGY